MHTIDLNKYKITVNWLIDDIDYNYIDEKINRKTNEILQRNQFNPVKIVVKIFPLTPYESISKSCNKVKLPNLAGHDDSYIAVESSVIYQPFRFEISNKNEIYVSCVVSSDNGIDTITHIMDFDRMVDDMKTIIKDNFTNYDEINNIINSLLQN